MTSNLTDFGVMLMTDSGTITAVYLVIFTIGAVANKSKPCRDVSLLLAGLLIGILFSAGAAIMLGPILPA